MKNIVVFKEPKLKPLPSGLPAVSDRDLPTRILAAERAVALCEDLSELTRMKDQLLALAVAAKIAKRPVIAQSANRVCKEAIFRIGDILNTMSNFGPGKPGWRAGRESSPRIKAATAEGFSKHVSSQITRIASAPQKIRERILNDDKISSTPGRMVVHTPVVFKNAGANKQSDALRNVLSGNAHSAYRGFSGVLLHLKGISMDDIRRLTPDEKCRAMVKLVESQELLDQIAQALE